MAKKQLYFLPLGLLLVFLLVACGGEVQPTAVVAVPTALPTATKAPTPIPPTPLPTPTLNSVATNEWGSVKSTGAEVKQDPDTSSATLEKLDGFTIVAWQTKLVDGTWYERAGGGWVRHEDVIIYGSEGEARRAVPKASPTPTPVPTYNSKPLPTGKVAYTFAPVVGTGAAPQYFTPVPQPRQPTPVPGSQPSTSPGTPTATPLTIITATPKPTLRPGAPTPTPVDTGN